MADNAAEKKPTIRFLRGDEVVLSPDGELQHAVDYFPNERGGSLRAALGVWPGGVTPTVEQLHKSLEHAQSRTGIDIAKARILGIKDAGRRTVKANYYNYKKWRNVEVGDLNQALQSIQRSVDVRMAGIRPTLSAISRDITGWLEKHKNVFKADSNALPILSQEEFHQDRDVILNQKVFTADLAKLFSFADSSIAIMPTLDGILPSGSQSDFFVNPHNGLIFDHKMVEELSSVSNEKRHKAVRNTTRGLIGLACFVIGIDDQLVGANDAIVWEKITNEFKTKSKTIMSAAQHAADSIIPGDYAITDILTQMHFALHSGFYDPVQVRADLPLSAAMYDRFMAAVRQRANALEKAPLYDPARLTPPAEAVDARALDAAVDAPSAEPPPKADAPPEMPEKNEFEYMTIPRLGELFLTPACIEHAKLTGEYRLVTFSEVVAEMDKAASSPSGAPKRLINPMMAAVTLGDNAATLANRLQGSRDSLARNHTKWTRPDGSEMSEQAVAHYFESALQDKEKWAEAAREQAVKQRHAFPEHFSNAVIRKLRDINFHTLSQQFTEKLNATVSPEARALIAQAGVNIIFDPFHISKHPALRDAVQNAIIIWPEYLESPRAMEVLGEEATILAMEGKPDKSVKLWELSRIEMEDTKDTMPASWLTGSQTPGRDIIHAASKDPKEFYRRLPATALADHLFDWQVRQNGRALLRGEAVVEPTASETAFTINRDELTPEQQRYFEKINEIIAALDITPAQLDVQFKHCAMVQDSVLHGMREDAVQRNEFLNNAGSPDVIARVPKAAELANSANVSRELSLTVREFMLQHLKPPLPFKATPLELKYWSANPKKEIKAPLEVTPTANLLESYASGERSMLMLPYLPLSALPSASGDRAMASISEVFEASLHNAIIEACRKQGKDELAIRTQLAELEAIGQEVFSPTPETVPYYTLSPKDAPSIPVIDPQKATVVFENTNLFLTPECIHHAQETGEFRFLTYEDVLKAKDDPNNPNNIHNLVAYFPALGFEDPTASHTFEHILQLVQKRHDNYGAIFNLPHGVVLDTSRYIKEVIANKDQWFAAAMRQSKAISSRYSRQDYKEMNAQTKWSAANEERLAREFDKDPELKVLAANAGFKIIIDFLHETPKEITVLKGQRSIIIHPEFLGRPLAVDIIKEAVRVSCDIYTETEPEKDQLVYVRSLSDQEHRLYSRDNLPASWRGGSWADSSAMRAIALAHGRLEPKLFRERFPCNYEYMRQWDAVLHRHAVQLLHGKTLPVTEATAEAFVPDRSQLTSAQVAYFEQLNQVIAKLGVSAPDFDTQMQYSIAQLQSLFVAQYVNQTAKQLGKEPVFEDLAASHGNFDKAPELVTTAIPANLNDKAKFADYEKLAINATLYQLIGLHSPPPVSALPHEQKLWDTTQKRRDAKPIAGMENVLQNYASGRRTLPSLSHMPLAVQTSNHRTGEVVYNPNNKAIFETALHNAVYTLCEKKGIAGDEKDAVLSELTKLEQLGKKAFLWSDELEKIETQAKTDADLQAKAETAAAAKAITYEPYFTPASGDFAAYRRINKWAGDEWIKLKEGDARDKHRQQVLRMRYLRGEELEPIRALLNAKLADHRELGGLLFSDAVLRRAEYACLQPSAETNKMPASLSEQERAGVSAALVHLFSYDLEAMEKGLREKNLESFVPEMRRRYEDLRARVMQSPTLIIAALGTNEDLQALQTMHSNRRAVEDEKQPLQGSDIVAQRAAMANRLLRTIPEIAALLGDSKAPASEAETPPAAAAMEEIAEDTTPGSVIVEAALAGGIGAAAIETVEEGDPDAGGDIEPDAVDMEPIEEEEGAETPESTVAAPQSTVDEYGVTHFEPETIRPLGEMVKDVPIAPRIQLSPEDQIKHAEAMAEAKDALLNEIMNPMVMASDGQYYFFECKIDRDPKQRMPIVLQFSKETQWPDGSLHKEKMKPYRLTDHYKYFAQHGVQMTLADAVELKRTAQNAIHFLQDDIFKPPLFTRKNGLTDVAYDSELPPTIYDYTNSKPINARVEEGSGGMCSLVIKVADPYRGREGHLDISIPLGIARKPYQQEETEVEIGERKKFVLDLIDKAKHERLAQRASKSALTTPYKNDVVEALKIWVNEREQVWDRWEPLPLPGFTKPQIIYRSADPKGQKISLAPVRLALSPGSDNPSWHMYLTFCVGEAGKNGLGEVVRGRDVNLHTSNPELAQRRAIESLVGAGNRFDGFWQRLQARMQQDPTPLWTVPERTKARVQRHVMIGKEPLHHWLDDMMRYEHDMGVRAEVGNIENGRAPLTIAAERAVTGDFANTVPAADETLYIKRKGEKIRVPVQVQLSIPAEHADSEHIKRFKDAVQEQLREFTDEHYSSETLKEQEGGVVSKRKVVPPYRTATIRDKFIDAIASKYEEFFSEKLPKKFEERFSTWGIGNEGRANHPRVRNADNGESLRGGGR